MPFSNGREPRHQHPKSPQIPTGGTLAPDTKITRMTRDGSYMRAADACMRLDFHPNREQFLAIVQGLRGNRSWQTKHLTRIVNLINCGVKLGVLSPERDEELYRDLKFNGITVASIAPPSNTSMVLLDRSGTHATEEAASVSEPATPQRRQGRRPPRQERPIRVVAFDPEVRTYGN